MSTQDKMNNSCLAVVSLHTSRMLSDKVGKLLVKQYEQVETGLSHLLLCRADVFPNVSQQANVFPTEQTSVDKEYPSTE